MLKIADLRMRDPFVLPCNGVYYLYGTIGECEGERSLYVFRSTDLEYVDDGSTIFTLPADSWASGELWAPEVHEYNSKFYLFVSLLGKHGLRGVQIAVSDTPDGTFMPVANAPATPVTQSCIDGTLYVENGTPYIVYSHDWPDCYYPEKDIYIGEICACELSKDLTHAVGEPFLLFRSTDAPVSAAAPVCHPFGSKPMVTRYGTDGPFFRRLADGTLFMIWSPIPNGNYMVLGVTSDNGSILGKWNHMAEPIIAQNGGHGMIFEDFCGNLQLSIHQPERYMAERPTFYRVLEKEGTIVLA